MSRCYGSLLFVALAILSASSGIADAQSSTQQPAGSGGRTELSELEESILREYEALPQKPPETKTEPSSPPSSAPLSASEYLRRLPPGPPSIGPTEAQSRFAEQIAKEYAAKEAAQAESGAKPAPQGSHSAHDSLETVPEQRPEDTKNSVGYYVIMGGIALLVVWTMAKRASTQGAHRSSSASIEVDPGKEGWEQAITGLATSHMSAEEKRRYVEELLKERTSGKDPFDHSCK
jgi:hypothetical protein